MATYVPSVSDAELTSTWSYTYNSSSGLPYQPTGVTSASKTRTVSLSAIPDGAEVTAVSYSCTTTNSPSSVGTSYIWKKFDNKDGSNLTSSSIKTYLNGLNRKYSGKSLVLYYGMKANPSAKSSPSPTSLKVTFATTLKITYVVYVYFGSGGAWVPCEMYYGRNGSWKQVIPYYGKNGEWKQA